MFYQIEFIFLGSAWPFNLPAACLPRNGPIQWYDTQRS